MDFYNLLVIVMMILGISSSIKGEINPASFKEISKINNNGPYIGIVVPNHYELKPLLNSSSFVAHSYFDIAGKFYNNIMFFQSFDYMLVYIHNHIFCIMYL
jgi:hypothetical protein